MKYLIKRADYLHFKDGDRVILPAISSGIVETNEILGVVIDFFDENFNEDVENIELKINKIGKPPMKFMISITPQPPTKHHPLEPDGVRPSGYIPSKGTYVA